MTTIENQLSRKLTLLIVFFLALCVGAFAQVYGEEEPNNSLAEALGGFTPDPLQQRIFQPSTITGDVSGADVDYWLIGHDFSMNFGGDSRWWLYLQGTVPTGITIERILIGSPTGLYAGTESGGVGAFDDCGTFDYFSSFAGQYSALKITSTDGSAQSYSLTFTERNATVAACFGATEPREEVLVPCTGPAAPTLTGITRTGTTTLRLDGFSAVADADGYIVEISDDGTFDTFVGLNGIGLYDDPIPGRTVSTAYSGSGNQIVAHMTTPGVVDVTGLSAGPTYTFKVTPYKNCLSLYAMGTAQTLSSVTCGAAVPEPTGLVVNSATPDGLTLATIGAATGATGYITYMSDSPTGFTAPDAIPTANAVYSGSGTQAVHVGTTLTPNQTITGVNGGTTYYFRTYAYETCSGTDFFSSNGFSTSKLTCEGAPNTPTILSITGISHSSMTVASVSPVANANGYVVLMNTTNSFTVPTDGTSLPTASTTYSGSGEQVVYAGTASTANTLVTGLDNANGGVNYFFRVYAFQNCEGNYYFENTGFTASARTRGAVQTQASNAIFFEVGDAFMDLNSFTGAAGANGHVIKMNTTNTFTAPADGSGTLPTASTNYTSGEQVIFAGTSTSPGIRITGLSAATTYHFAIYTYSNVDGQLYYNASAYEFSQENVKPTPSITFNDITKTYGDAAFGTAASSNSTGALTYSLVSQTGGGSAVAANGVITVGNVGTVTIQVDQVADATYNPRTAQATLTINKADPVLQFNPVVVNFGASDQTLTATAQVVGSGASASTGTISYNIEGMAPAGNVLSGTNNGTWTPGEAGTFTIRASIAADANYNAGFQDALFAVTAPNASFFIGGTSQEIFSLQNGTASSVFSIAAPYGTSPTGWILHNNEIWVTTSAGGANNKGTLFHVDTDGTNPAVVGDFPTAPANAGVYPPHVVDGKVWVVTRAGGTAGLGEIYSANTDGTGFQTEYTFTGASLFYPVGQLVSYGGKLYGVCESDATLSGGIFSLTPDGMGGYTYAEEFVITTADEKTPAFGLTLFNDLLWFSNFPFVSDPTEKVRMIAYDPATNTLPHSILIGEYTLQPVVIDNRLFAPASNLYEIQQVGASYSRSTIYTFTAPQRNFGTLTYDGVTITGIGFNNTAPNGFVYSISPDGSNYQVLYNATGEITLTDRAYVQVSRLTPEINFTNQTVDHLSVTTLNGTANTTSPITYELIGDATASSLVGNEFTAGNVGTVTIRASVVADANFEAATKDVIFTIQKADPSFTIADLTLPFGSSQQTLAPSATNYSGGTTTYQFVDGGGLNTVGPNTGSTITSGNRLNVNNPGNETIRATLSGTSNFNERTIDFQLTVNDAVADLSGFTDLTTNFFQPDVTLSVPSAPGVAVSYEMLTSNTGSRLSGANNSVLTIGNVQGTETIRVTVTEANYQPTTKDITLTVNRALPVLTWSNPADVQFAIDPLDTDRLNAVASVPGSITYYIGPAYTGTEITPGVTTLPSIGTHTLTAAFDPTDSDNYSSVTRAVTINATKINLEITIDDKVWVLGQPEPALTYTLTSGRVLTEAAYGHESFIPLTRGSDNTIGTYTIMIDPAQTGPWPDPFGEDGDRICAPGICIVRGLLVVQSTFYNITVVPGTFTITDKPQISASDITFIPPASLVYDNTPRTYTFSVATLDPVLPATDIDLTYEGRNGTTYASSATAPTNAGDYTVTATVKASNLDYGGSVSADFTLAPAPTTINLTVPSSNFVYTGMPQGVSAPTADDLSGNPTLALTTEYATSGATSFSETAPTDAGTYDVRVNLAASVTNYAATQASGTFTIDQRPQSITFNPIPEVACGQTTIDLSAYATSSTGATVAFASDNPAVVSITGNTANILGAGSVTITASQSGDANTLAAADQTQTLTVAATQENFSVDNPTDVQICNGNPYTLPALTSGNYFSGPGGTGTAYSAGDNISSTATLYVYGVSGVNPSCTDENSFTVTIESLPVDNVADVVTVGTYILPALTYGNYFVGSGGTGGMLSPGSVISSSQTIYIFNEDIAQGCTAESSFTVTINPAPALDFSGDLGNTYDYLEIADDNSIDFTTGMTFEAWVNFEQVNRANDGYDWQFLMGKTEYVESFGLMLLTDPAFPKNLVFWHPGIGDGDTQYLWPTVAADTWYHIAVTVDGTNGTNTYVNGVNVANESGGGTLAANALPIWIGANGPAGNTADPYPFQGMMDEVRFWNYARTEAQINSTKDVELQGTESGLVVYYNFNEGTIDGDNTGLTQVPDLSSAGNNATFNSFALSGTGSNYVDGSGNGVVPGLPQSITFNTLSNVTFGDADFDLTGTASSGLALTYTSSNTGVATVSGNTVTIVGAGTTTITASQGGNGVYLPASNVDQTLSVDPFAATISLNLPGTNPTYTGLQQGVTPTANDVSSNPTLTLVAEYSVQGANGFTVIAPTNAGTYDVRANLAGSETNYSAAQATGTFIIDKAPLTATLDDVSIVYGVLGMNNHPVTYSGFVNGETDVVLSITTGWPQSWLLDASNSDAFYNVGGPYAGAALWGSNPEMHVQSDNYSITFETGDIIEVTARPINVTANNRTITYGEDANVGNLVTFEANDDPGMRGLALGETSTNFTGTVTFDNITLTDVATHTGAIIPNGGLTNSNYSITYLPGDLTIDQATLTVKAQDITREYAAANPTVSTFEYTGFQNGDGTDGATDISGLTGLSGAASGTIAASADAMAAPGSIHAITVDVSGLSTTNYAFTADNTGNLTITKADQAITFGTLADRAVGDADFSLAATASSGLTVTYASSDLTVATVSGNTVTVVGAGTTNITASQVGDVNYNAAPDVVQTLTVDPAAITVTVDAGQTKVYGDADPTFTYTISSGSLVGSDVLSGELDRATGENVGTYAIGQGTLSNANYMITFVGNDFEITQKGVSVTGVSANSKVYDGTTAAALDISGASLVGIESGDLSNVSLFTATGTFAQVGIGTGLAVTPGLSLSGSAAGNYSLMQPTGLTANISAKVLTVTGVVADSKTYDGTADAVLNIAGASLAGIITGEETNVNLATATGAFAQPDAGIGIAVTSGLTLTGSAIGNYTLTQPTGLTANITPLAIAVTPNPNQSKAFDGQGVSTDPTLIYSHAPALIGSDAFAGALTRVDGSDVNTYAITQGTLALSSNYTLSLDAETFEITTLAVTVTPDAGQEKTYDAMGISSDPVITYQVSPALVGTDAFTGALTRAAGSDAGTYAIEIGSLATTGNYAVSLAPETFEVTPRLTLILSTVSKTYDGQGTSTDPELTFIPSPDLLGSDVFTGALAREEGSNVGNYNVTMGTLSAGGNYFLAGFPAIGFGSFSITPLDITVTPDAGQNRVYDGTDVAGDPTLTYTNTPLVGSDTFSGALTRAVGSDANTYAIEIGTLSAGSNYNLSVATETFEITPSGITVTADLQTKVYGEADPTFSYQITSGTLHGSDMLSGTLTRTTGEDVGNYAITQGTLSAGSNYALTFASADLTITQRNTFITVDPQIKVYGEADPEFTYSLAPGSSLVGSDTFSGTLSRDAGEDVGTYTITKGTLTLGGNYNLLLGPPTNLTVTERPIEITANDQSKTTGQADPSLTYTITSGSLMFSDMVSGSLARVSGETAGTYAINQGSLAVGANYDLTFVPGTLTITDQITQMITFDALSDKTFGDASFSLSATGGASGNPVTFSSSNTAVATVSGSTVTIVGAGMTNITASQVGNATYADAPDVVQVLTVNKAVQSISFTTASTQNIAEGTSRTLSATGGSSGNTVTFSSSNTSVATVSGNAITFLTPGPVTIYADQAGDGNYQAAPQVGQTITVEETYIWSGTVWNSGSTPTANKDLVFEGNYTLSGSMEAASSQVNVGVTLTIQDGAVFVNNSGLDNSGAVIVNSGGSLVLMAGATGSGYQINRNVTGSGGYSIVGSPVQGATASDLGADYLYGFDGASFTVPSGTDALTSGQGFFAGYDAASPKITFSGTPNSGNQSFNLPSLGQFHLVSNPYAAPLSHSALVAGNTSFDGTIYLWDDGGANSGGLREGGYVTVNAAGMATGSGGLQGSAAFLGEIGTAQGFFIYADAATSVDFTPAMQSAVAGDNADGQFYRVTEPQVLKLTASQDGIEDDLIVALMDGATTGFDRGLDARKLSNSHLNFYSLLDEEQLAIQAISQGLDQELIIPLGVESQGVGEITFSVDELDTFGAEMSLVDLETNTRYDLRSNSTLTFTLREERTTDRFELHLKQSEVLGEGQTAGKLEVYGNAEQLTLIHPDAKERELVEIYNMEGRLLFSQQVRFDFSKQAIIEPDIRIETLYLMRIGEETIRFFIR